MANLDPMIIDNFARITGGGENYAVYRLQQNGGDMNAALETHFGEGDIYTGFTQDSEDELIDIDVEEKTFPRELYASTRSTNLLADAKPNATANLVEVPVVEWNHFEVSEYTGNAPYGPAFHTSFHDSHDIKDEMIQDAIAASRHQAPRTSSFSQVQRSSVSQVQRSSFSHVQRSSFSHVQRSIREQQDEEYYASLQADREEEIGQARYLQTGEDIPKTDFW